MNPLNIFILATVLLLASVLAHVFAKEGAEFIVSDIDQILNIGVDVDPSYSERDHTSEPIVSAPGCPKSMNGFPWVLYGDPYNPKCYLSGESPLACPPGLSMYYQPQSHWGACQCNFQQCVDDDGVTSHRPSSDTHKFCRRRGWYCVEFVWFEQEKRCHEMYTQGPCNDTQWLVPDGQGGVNCSASRSSECPVGEDSGIRLDELAMEGEEGEEVEGNSAGEESSTIECCNPEKLLSHKAPGEKVDCGENKLWSPHRHKCVRDASYFEF